MMRRLIDDLFGKAFEGLGLQKDLDAAILEIDSSRIAFTTDSFVVDPLQFPGWDIGTLAVCGTVNDLATAGARPLSLAVAF
ncbi:MAG: AIR synthase related protein, partial [Myxococcota bacterium]